MAKKKSRFLSTDFIPTFGEEFSSLEEPEFDSQIWTTELVDDLVEKVEEYGLDLSKVKHPFFEKNIDLRQGRVAFQLSDMERSEFKKCRKDIVHFANTYIKLMQEHGIDNIELYPYQVEMLKMYQENRYSIVVGSRQIGKTVVAGIFLTWYLIFNADKNIMLAANKGDTAKEILDKVKSIVLNLPFWLKPGLISFRQFSLSTDANSKILATTTTDKAAIGFTIHLLFLDEFAHVRPNIQTGFYDNIYPVISSSKASKMIITSTPHGYEKFQELYQASVDDRNEFKNMNVPWWEVPGRDDEWARKQISNMGEDAFNEQFGCQFQRSDLLLLSSSQLKQLKNDTTEFVHHGFESLDNFNLDYNNLVWRKDYEIENLSRDTIIVSIDLAEGVGRDYTVMQLFRVAPKVSRDINVPDNEVFELDKHFYLEQVGIFRDNLMSIDEFAKLCYNMFFNNKIFDLDRFKVVLEWNTYGSFFDEKMKHLFGGDLYDDSVYLKTFHRKGAISKRIGVKQDSETKPRNCAEIKNCIDKRTVVIFDKWTIQEFSHFTRNKKGSFEASTGNDDAVMAAVNLVEIFRDTIYKDMIAEAFEVIDAEHQQHINKLMNSSNSLDESTDFLGDSYRSPFGTEHTGPDTNANWF
jgi:hypothetical protein